MISKSIQDTERIAHDFALKLKPQLDESGRGATVIALSGELGAGKTTFTKSFASYFGISKDDITSPTFVIMKSYALEGKKFETLIHIDAYRIENLKEMERLGLRELLLDPGNIILIEWPEKIRSLLSPETLTITLSHKDENTREIVFN